jgi:hypothetical protein
LRQLLSGTGREWLAVRIGIDMGPVVAGVIGRRKFIYDLWGDTVNTAEPLGSQGPVLGSCSLPVNTQASAAHISWSTARTFFITFSSTSGAAGPRLAGRC